MSEEKDKAVAVVNDVAAHGLQLDKLNLKQIYFIGNQMAQSGMFDDVQDASKALVKILAGQEIGVTPFQAMTNIHIIKNKATMSANLMAAKVKGSAKYDYKVIKMEADACELEFYELPIGGKPVLLGKSSFTAAEARTAGTQNMSKFPRNMLFARAMSNGTKWYCPDVFNGNLVYTPDELGARVNEDGEVIDIPAEQPKVEPAPKPEAKKVEVPDKKPSPIVLIGEELKARGFESPEDRQKIAFTIANVKKASELDENGWIEVLDSIKESDDDALKELLAPEDVPEEGDDAPEITDEDLENIGTEEAEDETPADTEVTMPTFKKGSTPMVRPEMRKFAKELYTVLGLETTAKQKVINSMLGFEKVPTNFDDYYKLLEELVKEVNKVQAGGK